MVYPYVDRPFVLLVYYSISSYLLRLSLLLLFLAFAVIIIK